MAPAVAALAYATLSAKHFRVSQPSSESRVRQTLKYVLVGTQIEGNEGDSILTGRSRKSAAVSTSSRTCPTAAIQPKRYEKSQAQASSVRSLRCRPHRSKPGRATKAQVGLRFFRYQTNRGLVANRQE